MSNLKLTGITKRFGKLTVLDDINLTISDGEFVVLVGPSGCGKSTLLNVIAGLESISSGEIKINDKIVNDFEPKERDIAMVFQSYALYPNLNVYENISFGLKNRKINKDEIDKRVTKVVKQLQIDHLLTRKPSQLSGGQRQRVAMGRAIARDPQIYLFDEPLSNLDAKLRVEMRMEIKLLHNRVKNTVVYVTHDQTEAMTLADRIALLNKGKLVQLDDPMTIYQNPVNIFVANFIGSPSMNLIPTKLTKINDKIVFTLTNSDNKEFQIPIEEKKLEKAKAYIGKDVIIGIRPEHINQFIEDGGSDHVKIEAIKSFIEPTGSDIYFSFIFNGVNIISRFGADFVNTSSKIIPLQINLSKVLAFDPDTELRIF